MNDKEKMNNLEPIPGEPGWFVNPETGEVFNENDPSNYNEGEDGNYGDEEDWDDENDPYGEDLENDNESNEQESDEGEPNDKEEKESEGGEGGEDRSTRNALKNSQEGAKDVAKGAEEAAEDLGKAGARGATSGAATGGAAAGSGAAASGAAAGGSAAAGGAATAGGTAAAPWIAGAVAVVVVVVLLLLFFLALMGYGTEEGTASTPPGPAPSQGGVPENVKEQGKGWNLINGTDYSEIPCAKGTEYTEIYNHPVNLFTIRLCQSEIGKVASIISQDIVNMINAAKEDGITLRASGSFRSAEAQIRLRKAHCPDWRNSRSSDCNPPTARPGRSMHERGLATDFLDSNNRLLTNKRDPVFIWLQENASRFGYHNFAAEPWHWSTNGR